MSAREFAGHTPGRWSVRRESDASTGWRGISVQSESGLVVANLVGQLDDSELANARLIASAPDLLADNERLRARLAEMELVLGRLADGQHLRSRIDLVAYVLDEARAALQVKP